MTTKQQRQIDALTVAIDAAETAKNVANDAMDAAAFYSACDLASTLWDELCAVQRGTFRGCSVRRQLVATNCD